MKSAAYLGLVVAAEKYRSDASSFVTYATIKIQGSMKDYVRELKWGTRKNRKKAVSLTDYAKKESNIFEITFDLKAIEKKVISMYYEGGYTLKEIGKEIGVSESRVSQLLNQVRSTIKEQYAA